MRRLCCTFVAHSRIYMTIIIEAMKVGAVWALEQPAASYMWHIPELKRILSQHASYEAVFDWCRLQRVYRHVFLFFDKCVTVHSRRGAWFPLHCFCFLFVEATKHN